MNLKSMLCLYLLLHMTFHLTAEIHLWSKFSKLKKKISAILNKQRGDNPLLDIDKFEYPRANKTLRELHEKLWQEYYNCLKSAYNDIGSEKVLYPKSVEALEGTTITLKCELCISPIEVYDDDIVEWYSNSTANNQTNGLVEESYSTIVSPEEKSLTINNINFDQAGHYWCKLGDTLSGSYHVSIDTDVEGLSIVHPATAPNGPYPMSKTALSEYNVNIDTTWTKWSTCSRCDIVGKRIRYGYCIITYDKKITKKNVEIQEYEQQSEQNEPASGDSKNLPLSEKVVDKMKKLLKIFRHKLPCKNEYLPKKILDIPYIKNRKTELMEQYCKVKCSQNQIFEVRDKAGKVLESANNSAGIFSMVQGIPEQPPPVTHTTIYQRQEEKAILICPGNLNSDIPVNWKVDNTSLHPVTIKEQSLGRIYINSQMHIVFTSLKFEDSNIYSCWQRNDIIGVIKLNVTGEIELQTHYSAIMLGAILVILVFLLVFWRAYQGQKRFTIH